MASFAPVLYNFSQATGPLGHNRFFSGNNGTAVMVAAYSASGSPETLFGKADGGDENGLGIAGQPHNEIQPTDYIQIDLAPLLRRFGADAAIQLQMGSVQGGESYAIYGSHTAGGPLSQQTLLSGAGTGDGGFVTVHPNGFRYLSVTAHSGDVLLAKLQVQLAQPPTINDLSYSTPEGKPLVVSAANGLLANAKNPSGGTLTIELLRLPTKGQLKLSPDGSFLYLPYKGESGFDGFAFQAVNAFGQVSNVAAVQLLIMPVAANREIRDTTTGPGVVPGNSEYYYNIKFDKPVFAEELSGVIWQTANPNTGIYAYFTFPNKPLSTWVWADYKIGLKQFGPPQEYSSLAKIVEVVEVQVSTAKDALPATRNTAAFPAGVNFIQGRPVALKSTDDYQVGKTALKNVPSAAFLTGNVKGQVERPGLQYRAVVTLKGPTVSDVKDFGVSEIHVGFVQHVKIDQWVASYATTPETKLTLIQEQKTFQDSTTEADRPWTTRSPSAVYFSPTVPNPKTGGFTKEIQGRDTPSAFAPLAFANTAITKFDVKESFVLDVAAVTLESASQANTYYYKEATAKWSWDAALKVKADGVPETNGKVTPPGNAWDTNIPKPTFEDTSGPLANNLLEPTIQMKQS